MNLFTGETPNVIIFITMSSNCFLQAKHYQYSDLVTDKHKIVGASALNQECLPFQISQKGNSGR